MSMSSSYFGVQLKKGETPHDIAKKVVTVSASSGLSYTELETLDTFTVGSQKFVRLRVNEGSITKVLETLQSERGIIAYDNGSFYVRLADGRKSSYPTATMLSVPRQPISYRGPGMQYWQRQFP